MNSKIQKQGTETKPSQEQIAVLAYCLWQKEGCKAGHDLDYWLQAETQLNGRCPSAPQQRPAADPVQKTAIEARGTKNNNNLRRTLNRELISTTTSRH